MIRRIAVLVAVAALAACGHSTAQSASAPSGSGLVGYVDQAAIDATPKVKAATDEFLKFKQSEDQSAAAKLKSAKSNADRDAVLRDYRKTLDDKQNTTLKPVVDATRDAISQVAKEKGLILVVDKGNIIFGGTDITSDVTAKLK